MKSIFVFNLSKFLNRGKVFYKLRYKLLLRKIDKNELDLLFYNTLNHANTLPNYYYRINNEIQLSSCQTDIEKALQLAKWLRTNATGGSGIGGDSEETLKKLLEGGKGVCSDFSQVYNNLCVINDIRVREWGILNSDSLLEGHSYNEVYLKEKNKWVLIDVSKLVYFTSSQNSDELLSVLEVFDKKQFFNKKAVHFSPKFYHKSDQLDKIYFTRSVKPFVIDNYSNQYYDDVIKKFKSLPTPIIHSIPILFKKSYRFCLIED